MFDFNKDPFKMYGLFPMTPFPIELSVYGTCSNACFYCFANLNRAANGREHFMQPTMEKTIRAAERAMRDPKDPRGYFLRERYPICFSNTTDPFQKEERVYRCSEMFLRWAKGRNLPLWIQTKGGVLAEEFDRYAPLIVPGKDVVYVTLCTLDDAVSRHIEPGAISATERLEMIRRLSDRGVPVVVSCTPYLKEWAGDLGTYCRTVADAGARGVWVEGLHFSKAQMSVLPKAYREYGPKANLESMYMIGQIKAWLVETAKAGLDCFPNPRDDGYFGHHAKHPECADPEWFGPGSHLFDWGFRLTKHFHDIAYQGQDPFDRAARAKFPPRRVLFTWEDIEGLLLEWGFPNPVLRVDPFWLPFNVKIKADRRRWNLQLGRNNTLLEIMRYFWNQPWENQNWIWYHPLTQHLYNESISDYIESGRGDLVGVLNPDARHNGPKIHDVGALRASPGKYLALGAEGREVLARCSRPRVLRQKAPAPAPVEVAVAK